MKTLLEIHLDWEYLLSISINKESDILLWINALLVEFHLRKISPFTELLQKSEIWSFKEKKKYKYKQLHLPKGTNSSTVFSCTENQSRSLKILNTFSLLYRLYRYCKTAVKINTIENNYLSQAGHKFNVLSLYLLSVFLSRLNSEYSVPAFNFTACNFQRTTWGNKIQYWSVFTH